MKQKENKSSERVVCNYCGTHNGRTFLKTGEFRYAKCPKCGLVYQNPRPTPGHLRKKVYNRKYFGYEKRNEENFHNLMLLNLRDLGMDGPGRGRRFLDIGCATGRLLDTMRSRGWKVEGVELTPESARYARKRYKVRVKNTVLEKAGYRKRSFDLVHISHVVEHVPDPMAQLGEIRRVLKPSGRLVLVTPNIAGLQALWFRENWRSAHRDHLTLFSTRTLKAYFRKTGFKVLRQFSYGGLAKGVKPYWFKKPLDFLAKLLNFGDVTAFLCGPGLKRN